MSHSGPPSISSAVDVYSCGVVFFQMLYGRKPFGQGLSSDDMAALAQRTQKEQHRVVFPPDKEREAHGSGPALGEVSKGARDFIAECLQFEPALRPKVDTILTDPEKYFRMSKLK